MGLRAGYKGKKMCSGLSASSKKVSNGITELPSILDESATKSTQMGLVSTKTHHDGANKVGKEMHYKSVVPPLETGEHQAATVQA